MLCYLWIILFISFSGLPGFWLLSWVSQSCLISSLSRTKYIPLPWLRPVGLHIQISPSKNDFKAIILWMILVLKNLCNLQICPELVCLLFSLLNNHLLTMNILTKFQWAYHQINELKLESNFGVSLQNCTSYEHVMTPLLPLNELRNACLSFKSSSR